jgi:hypothetical protein
MALAASLALALAVLGCASDYVTENDASVFMRITSINAGAVLDSDIRFGEGSSFVCEDEVDVAVAVRNKNPNAPVPSVPNAVFLQSYEVRYFRTDGRGVEGIDVPYRITGNLTQVVDVANDGSVVVPIEVVRRQAKLEPPLSTIFQTAVLTSMAEVTIYGETPVGKRVSASARFQIDFADFGDTETTCPD